MVAVSHTCQAAACALLRASRKLHAASSRSCSTISAAGSSIQLLESLVNYERAGIPTAAGTAASDRFDLARMERLLEALGNPQRQLQAVHVAGSKGRCGMAHHHDDAS